MAAIPIVNGRTALPKMPTPNAPIDWNVANHPPAVTAPNPAWIPAAIEPPVTPTVPNPTLFIAIMEVVLINNGVDAEATVLAPSFQFHQDFLTIYFLP